MEAETFNFDYMEPVPISFPDKPFPSYQHSQTSASTTASNPTNSHDSPNSQMEIEGQPDKSEFIKKFFNKMKQKANIQQISYDQKVQELKQYLKQKKNYNSQSDSSDNENLKSNTVSF